MTMSIAFITLIFGFLLGKFTSDRNHIIKENYKRQHDTHKTVIAQNEVDKLINSVIDAAKTNYKDHTEGTKNAKYFERNFTNCLIDDNSHDHLDEDFDDFLSHFLRHYYDMYLKCANDLRKTLLLNN